MDALERALRGSAAPVRYTEGHNPHIRLSMGPSLPLGHEGLAEILDVDCTAPVRPQHVAAMNRLLPEGLEILEAEALVPGAPSLGKMTAAALYVIRRLPERPWPETPDDLSEEVRSGVLQWQLQANGDLSVKLNLRQSEGPTPSVKVLLRALDVPEERIPTVRVCRRRLVLRPASRRWQAAPTQPATVGEAP
jgi:radical SAM-linked protein